MADLLQGMFTTPEEIRAKRYEQMMAQQQANSQMGGSLAGLLGQVAAGGNITGQMLAEGAGGMFGLKTPEEANAEKVQGIMTQVKDSDDPNVLLSAAKQLNDMGMIKEALYITDRARQMRFENSAESRAQAQLKLQQDQLGVSQGQLKLAQDQFAWDKAKPSDRFKVVGNRIFDTTLNDGNGAFIEMGELPPDVDGQIIEVEGPDGRIYRQTIDRNTGDKVGQAYLVPKEGIKLSVGEQNIVDKSMDAYINASNTVSTVDNLITTLTENPFSGGKVASSAESVKGLTGNRDLTSYVKTEVNKLRALEAMDSLPPGSASDADVALALSGVPPEGASSKEYVRWLEALRKTKQKVAEYNEFKANYYSAKGTAGFPQAWAKHQADKANTTTSDGVKTANWDDLP